MMAVGELGIRDEGLGIRNSLFTFLSFGKLRTRLFTESIVRLCLMVSFPQPKSFRSVCVSVLPMKISGWDSLRISPTFFRPTAGSRMMGMIPNLSRAKANGKNSMLGGDITAAVMFGVSEQACPEFDRRA